MKRVVCLALVAALLFAGICIYSKREQSAVLREYLNNLDTYHSPTRDVGHPISHIQMNLPLAVGILYPETEYPFLNEAIAGWVQETAREYARESENAVSAELSVSYESHQVSDTIVSVRLQGSYLSSAMAHPVDIIQTFHADLRSETLMPLSQVLKAGQQQAFTELLTEKLDVDPLLVDDHILDKSLLTSQGIQITLARGDYFPMSEGTKEVFLPYEEIPAYLRDDFYPEVPREPAHETVSPSVSKPEPVRAQLDPNKPMLALTFDDGPSPHTDRLLDIFKEHGGHGTFFVLGELIDNRQSTLVRISREGHEIGNHTWSHRQLTNLSEQEILDQIMTTRAKIYDVTGLDCLTVRPPYGAFNDTVQAIGDGIGVCFINWSVDTLDWKTRDAQAVYEEILSHASNGAIILCHDLHSTTVDAMELVIPKLLEEGYQLVTVTQLLECNGNALEAGKMYYEQ